jgi:hypothetical protein
VNDCGPPLDVAEWAPLTVQEIVYQVPLTLTGSLKFIVMFVLGGTFEAPPVGLVLDTDGAASPPVVTVCEPSPPKVSVA